MWEAVSKKKLKKLPHKLQSPPTGCYQEAISNDGHCYFWSNDGEISYGSYEGAVEHVEVNEGGSVPRKAEERRQQGLQEHNRMGTPMSDAPIVGPSGRRPLRSASTYAHRRALLAPRVPEMMFDAHLLRDHLCVVADDPGAAFFAPLREPPSPWAISPTPSKIAVRPEPALLKPGPPESEFIEPAAARQSPSKPSRPTSVQVELAGFRIGAGRLVGSCSMPVLQSASPVMAQAGAKPSLAATNFSAVRPQMALRDSQQQRRSPNASASAVHVQGPRRASVPASPWKALVSAPRPEKSEQFASTAKLHDMWAARYEPLPQHLRLRVAHGVAKRVETRRPLTRDHARDGTLMRG